MLRGNCDLLAGKPTVITRGPHVLAVLALAIGCGQGLSTPRAGARPNDADTRTPIESRNEPGPAEVGSSVGDALPAPSDVRGVDETAPSPGPQSKQFPAAVGGDFDFGEGRMTITSNTFEGPVTLTQSIATPPRLGPVGATHELSVSPRMKTKIAARIRLRVPAAWKGEVSTWQLAYFKPKPADPPGLWLPCNQAEPVSDERALEGEAPPFDVGIEHFALLRRCGGGTGCDPALFCLSGLCQ